MPKRLYDSRAWRAVRLKQLTKEPLCAFCLRENIATQATVADHIIPHNENPELFWDEDNLQSLCHMHHVTVKARIDHGTWPKVYNEEGWPTLIPAKGLTIEEAKIFSKGNPNAKKDVGNR